MARAVYTAVRHVVKKAPMMASIPGKRKLPVTKKKKIAVVKAPPKRVATKVVAKAAAMAKAAKIVPKVTKKVIAKKPIAPKAGALT